MSTINDSGWPRSNRNPILSEFREDGYRSVIAAHYWARQLNASEATDLWTAGATVSEQVFAARVLYRYAAVFGGVA